MSAGYNAAPHAASGWIDDTGFLAATSLASWAVDSLCQSTLGRVRARGIRTPLYDRNAVQTGLLHFGPGAFHRAHQASYIEDLLEHDPRWGISAVSLQSASALDALRPQDYLYTLAVVGEPSSLRVMGALREILVARESPASVLSRLIDPATKLVTATVTEKGYCLNADGSLDFSHPDIQHDLLHRHAPRTLVGFLAAGLRLRYEERTAPPNIVSCDNLADNGRKLGRAVVDFTRRYDPQLARWIEANVAFASSMVDSIAPATDASLRERVAQRLGVVDRWPVQREPYTQWVIEDVMRRPVPDWASMGITITDDVGGFERAKLRLLNGAHSSLAYLGTLAGYATVAQAMRDDALAGFVNDLMIHDIQPSIQAPRGLDLRAYIGMVQQRLRNPLLQHRLAQIACDGSQKLPIRLLTVIADNLRDRRPIERACVPVAAWFHFVRRATLQGKQLHDPLAAQLSQIARHCEGKASADVASFLTLEAVFPHSLAANAAVRAALEFAYARLLDVHNGASLMAALGHHRWGTSAQVLLDNFRRAR